MQRHHKRTHDDGGEHGGAWTQIIELPNHYSVRSDVNPNFLLRLAQRRAFERAIVVLPTSAWETNLTAPGISRSHGAANQQEFRVIHCRGRT